MENKNWKRTFIAIYTGQAFSLLGSAAVQFAIIWWLTVYSESAMMLTFATIASFLPNMLLGPFAGVWIDRYNRKSVMIAADGLVALSSIALGLAFFITPTPPIWFIFSILFIRGIGNTFHSPAMQSAIPMFVPSDLLTKAGGWGNLITSISTMLGPALGAGLMAFFPIAPIMLVDILGAIIAILCLLTIHLPNIARANERVHLLDDTKQGFTALKENKPLMAAFIPVILSSLLYMPLGALYPLLVRVHYMGEASHNAIVEFVFSAGMLLSSLLIGIWGTSKKRFLMISLSITMLGVASFISGILPKEDFILFVLCCFIMGASGTFFNVPLMAHIQETVEPQMMGKVFSLLTTAMTLATPFGLILAGPVSEKIGANLWFAGSGILLTLIGIICFLTTRKYERT